MYFKNSICSLVLLVASSLPAAAEKFTCGSDQGFSPYALPDAATLGFDHLKYAPLDREGVRDYGVFASRFDGPDDDGDGILDMRAGPVWVSYELKGLADPGGDLSFKEPDISINRPGDWYKSTGYDFLWTQNPAVTKRRIDNSYDGIGSIWNRGHLMMADHAQRVSWEASCNTHIYWNAVPQAAAMNQGPWLHIESYVAALSNRYGAVWTIAGPIYDPDTPILAIGDEGEIPVSIPHALFKVIVMEGPDGVPLVRAFRFDQPAELGANGKPRPTATAAAGWVKCNQVKKKQHVYDHKSRLVALSDLMQKTGLTFPDALVTAAAADPEATSSLWSVDTRYWSGAVCGGQKYVP
ncbi:DNA/RNA non-specific endonuclease [Gimibacter soli]|uniref:DNA/RNA non-specific endonuclease n=1 Tax=Gimibacter soli TaxID=3024400 RepID=A0AAF0BLK9_9PROT|nr:DNA/RNA non-specific endonuclease [Gimibacter soli]WCL55604.1 DNA/RNA non-specific endonuclease [Gimibacter soli]